MLRPFPCRYASKCVPPLIFVILLVLIVGCTSLRSPTDEEAVSLLKNYYLFYYEGREIEAKVIRRGNFDRQCKCYPIEFEIISSGRTYTKTFYFFRNKAGKTDIQEFKYLIK